MGGRIGNRNRFDPPDGLLRASDNDMVVPLGDDSAMEGEMIKKYRVLNPNNIPKGIRLIAWKGKEWFEGDEFVPPRELNPERLLQNGHIEEVTGG